MKGVDVLEYEEDAMLRPTRHLLEQPRHSGEHGGYDDEPLAALGLEPLSADHQGRYFVRLVQLLLEAKAEGGSVRLYLQQPHNPDNVHKKNS